MENTKQRIYRYTFILVLALFVTACGASTERRIEEGNQAFQDEAYLVALQAYKDAEAQSPDLAEPRYNAANALYRESAFADASEALSSALDLVEDADLEENSLFNLGNTSYNLEDWEAAIAAYTQALLLDPGDQEAKYNLELAQSQQEQQEQQEQEQNEQDREEQNENDEGSSEEDQNQGEGENSEEKSDAEQEDTSGPDEESTSGDKSGEDSEQSNNSDPQGENNEDAGNEADQDSENQTGGSGQEGEEKGKKGSYILEPGERMSKEQAQQLLAAIAENSETLMEKLAQIFSVPFSAPLQDW